ncbi:hypothetical protein HCQ42_004140 [Escherichia coli]|uniref:hypothetical protein n=1 Tax=Escherichia coli TaxID=562 RepID=UPI00101E99DC|nr:hypothetical protein [Escherichia coli]EFB4760473.1 hypothetical protein [Escherichia coli]EFB5197600.1 hypothetical protein [Escherichia coli]EFM2063669.1 hypothetical protein [Escherichia coli]EHK7486449.1 hypothetical protein [Escherichia coli]
MPNLGYVVRRPKVRGRATKLRKDAKPINPDDFDGNFIRELEPIFDSRERKRRIVELECFICGHRFSANLENAKRVRQKTCSNKCAGIYRQDAEYKVMENPLYWTWASMKARCNNPNRARYEKYGGRGISYATEFEDFDNFYRYVSVLEGYPFSDTERVVEGVTLDRIDSSKGYEPGNLRWADKHVQSANKQGKVDGSTSKFTGVHYCKTNKVWVARVVWKGECVFLYQCHDELEAYLARKRFIEEHNLPHFVEMEVTE